MKISCPACAAKYSIADEKVQDKLAKIRCRKCGTTIVIDGKVNPPNVYAGEGAASQAESPAVSDPSAAGGAGEYSVDFGDNDQRQMTLTDIVTAYNSGQVTAETFVWAEGMADWQALGQVPAIVEALHAASQPAAAPAPAAPLASAPALQSSDIQIGAAPSPSPWEAASPKVQEAPSGSRAAAKAGGGRGSTADLFGAYESAGGEADVHTSAPAPAAGPSLGSAPAGGGTGARNESSVLFSLSALTATAKTPSATTPSPAVSTGSATKEDSGLIDLKALTAAAEPSAPMPMAPLAPSPLGMAPPLGLAPPLGGGVEAQIAMPMGQPTKSRTGLYIGAGIAVAAIAIAGAIVVTSKQPPPPPAPTVVATQAPAPQPTPTPAPEESTTAKPPATGTAEETTPKDKVATGGKRPSGGVAKPSGGTSKPTGDKPTGGTEVKKPPKPSGGGCGCAPGDLQCAMKCAAGGG